MHNIARITRNFEYVVNAQRLSKGLEPRPVEFQYWTLPVANNGTIETTWIHAVFNAHMVSRCRKPLRDLLDMYQSQITMSGRDFTSPELTFDVDQIFHSTVACGLGSLFLEICDVLPANTFWQEQYGANNVGHGSPPELDVVVVDFVVDCIFNWVITGSGSDMQGVKATSYAIFIAAHDMAMDALLLSEAVNGWPDCSIFQSFRSNQ